MDNLQVINHRQIAWLTGSLVTGGGLISIQQELVRLAKMDAWASYFLPLLYALAIGWFLCFMNRLFPGKNLFEISRLLLGKWGGSFVNAVIVFHIWTILVRDICSIGRFIGTVLLPNTPLEVIMLLFIALLVYFGQTSVEVSARVNDIFFPVFALLMLSTPIILLNELDISSLEPVFTRPAVNLLSANVLSTGWYSDVLVFGAFLHAFRSGSQLRSAVKHGVLIGTVLLTVVLFTELGVFGANIPGNTVYPSFSVVQQIHITDFLDRLDIVNLSIWFPVIVTKISAIYIAMLYGIGSFCGTRDYTMFNKPAGLLLLISAFLGFRSTTDVFGFGNFVAALLTVAVQLPIVVLLFMLAKIKSRKISSHPVGEQQQAGSGNAPSSPPQQKKSPGSKGGLSGTTARISSRFPSAAWRLWGNLLLACCLGLLAIGLMLGKSHTLAADACGIAYYAALFAACIVSYFEMHSTSTP